MLKLSSVQRNFISGIYKETKGCYATVAREFASKFEIICPPLRVVQAIVLEDDEVHGDDRIIRDVSLTQLSPAKPSKARKLSNSITYAVSVNQKSNLQSLQNLRNAALKCSSDLNK